MQNPRKVNIEINKLTCNESTVLKNRFIQSILESETGVIAVLSRYCIVTGCLKKQGIAICITIHALTISW